MAEPLQLTETALIGENQLYQFAIGLLGDRWVGFAVGKDRPGKRRMGAEKMLFILPGVSEDCRLGLTDRNLAIRMTTAAAQDPEGGYGVITHWHVGPELRAGPDEFRCSTCSRLGCQGDCGEVDYGENEP